MQHKITKAVEELGWHPEPSLANRWPHNTVHERWTGTCKSVITASMLQSDFPQQVLLWVLSYASIVLFIVQLAPTMPQEKDAAGNILKEYEWKKEQTCWQVHHDGKSIRSGSAIILATMLLFKSGKSHMYAKDISWIICWLAA